MSIDWKERINDIMKRQPINSGLEPRTIREVIAGVVGVMIEEIDDRLPPYIAPKNCYYHFHGNGIFECRAERRHGMHRRDDRHKGKC
jgi:hypothetical protein